MTASVAEAVVKEALDSGVARRHLDHDRIPEAVAQAMWKPDYLMEEPAPVEAADPSNRASIST